MKRIAFLVALTSLVAVVAAGSGAARPAATGTITQTAAASPQFSTLVSLLQKAGLAKTLAGKGPYTVFAPTNAAFAKVPKATLDALAADPAKLKAVLLYHVVKGRVPAAKVVKLASVKTLEGQTAAVSVMGAKVTIGGAPVVKTDVKATNGVIHVIDRVLLPPANG